MDRNFEILEHTADLKIKAYGKNLAGVFVNMAAAIEAEQLRPQKLAAQGESETIEIESTDLRSLLVDWLSEILYRGEVNKKVYTDFDVIEFSEEPYRIKARIKGVSVEVKNIDIKAVTYHDLEINKIDGHWEAVVVFDI